MRYIVASITSPKLCGGIFVAYPAEMPIAPLTRRLGYLAGKTVGSNSLSSKFGAKAIVFLSISRSYSPLNLDNLASV